MDGFIDDALVVALVEEGPYLIELCDRMDELSSFIVRGVVPSFSNASMSSMRKCVSIRWQKNRCPKQ